MDNWVVFEDLLKTPIRNGLTKPKAIRGNGVKMIAMGEIFSKARIGDMIMDRVPVSEKELTSCGIEVGDLLFARQSLVLEGAGKCSIVTAVTEPTVFESHLIRVRIDKEKADPYFVFYYFNSPHGRKNIKTIVEQVAAAGIRGSDLVKLSIPCPEISQQRCIARILRFIDEKIEINEKINDNLQQQLATIYKSWYQDYSRVADKEFVETEHGLIPEGWHYSLLGDLCQSISISHKFDKEELIFLNTGDVEDGRFLHSDYIAIKEMPGQAKKTIAPGDILYSEIRPINRHFAFVNFPSSDYVVSTKLMVIRARSFDSIRLYHYLTSDNVLAELQLQAESRSGTFPQIRFDNVSRLPILIADEQTENDFVDLLHTVYAQIEHINTENERLADLRDNLLPKLMSGEIDVSSIQI